MQERRAQDFVERLIAEGAATAAAAGVAGPREVEKRAFAAAPGLAVGGATRFDLASLTKPFTATLALLLDASGQLPLDVAIGELWPHAAEPLAHRSLEDLLRHRSGLAAWAPLYALVPAGEGSRSAARDEILSGRWLAPTDSATVYSDLGYILYGFAAEAATGESLEDLIDEHLTIPWKLTGLGPATRPSDPSLARPLASPMTTAREVELAAGLGLEIPLLPAPTAVETESGVPAVQDGNARFLGAVPGHAGLFAPLPAVLAFGGAWLRAATGDTSGPLDPALARRALDRPDPAALPDAARPIGWALPPADAGLSTNAFGHNGFTGTSLWIDPAKERASVLLATRVKPLESFERWRAP